MVPAYLTVRSCLTWPEPSRTTRSALSWKLATSPVPPLTDGSGRSCMPAVCGASRGVDPPGRARPVPMADRGSGTASAAISQVSLLSAPFGSRGLLPTATAPALFSSNKDPADRTFVVGEPKVLAPCNSDTERNMPATKTRTRIPKAMRWSRLSLPLFKCHQPDGLLGEL